MALKNLKLRFKKNSSSSSDEFSKNEQKESSSSLDSDETEITIAEEDEAKYGYNTYNDVEPKHSLNPTSYNAVESDSNSQHQQPQHHHERRMAPRRSSLRGSNGPRQRARRHSLTFSSEVVVQKITPTQEMAKKKSLWFGEKDYDKMKDKIFMIAEQAREGNGQKHCTRGLESIILDGSEERKFAAWDAVLDEQEHQIQSGAEHFDEDALSQSYRDACEESRTVATARAQQDEKAVAEYLAETRRYCRRMSL
ncbi:unnamed protein product [Cylindrotheca closterium]|uniref:Uncharacterized protein n=1 Tax=Cylindrotheca closterium TaxID=2856 RepID=A0AAD2G9I5_9STRA|nr:unnamed protein product [Cylindrotheca closterium]